MGSYEENDSSQNIDQWQARVRALNDQFRKDRKGGFYRLTKSMVALGYEKCTEVLQAIADYDGFTAENDPPGLHNFGCIRLNGERYFWNIDYFDKSETNESPDPADASVTVRFLNIMSSSDLDAA
jgi:Protein of unknown function (DUF3768)